MNEIQPITRRAFLKGAGIACASLAALQAGTISIEHPVRAQIQYEYDENGRLRAVTYPDRSRVEYAYDDAGKVAKAAHHRNGFYLA